MQTIKVASRDSKLAVVQAQGVIDAVAARTGQTPLLITMKTTGDLILDRTLDKIGGKGLFVKELEQALLERRADFTVHSLKDMPMDMPEELPIVAYSKRADARDVLVLPAGESKLREDKPIGCSSARRRIQLKKLYPHMQVAPVRGNVPTRLAKLDEGQFSALVLAAAGLKRLGLEERISRYFTYEEILPAAGQGIIAVQGRKGEEYTALAGYHDEESRVCALAERAFVRTLDGGCSSPVAAFAVLEHGVLTLRGMYVSDNEERIALGKCAGSPQEAAHMGRELALRLKEEGNG